MTLIAAYKTSEGLWIGSDSLGSNGHTKNEYGSKLISIGNYILGFSWSYRVADLILTNKDLFPKEITSREEVITKFVPALIQLLIEKGKAINTAKDGEGTVCHPTSIIIATKEGKIFHIQNDYAVFERDDYLTTGSGESHANGALYTLKSLGIKDGHKALTLAIQSAILHCTSVGGKIYIKKMTK
jgi:ATP-dependent protease HslVU (ClpYQ) peptidase subunit